VCDMKKQTQDLLLIAGAILGGIFVLPNLMNVFNKKPSDIPFDDSGFLDFLNTGGRVKEETTNDLPWWTYVSPFSMFTAYFTRGGSERTYYKEGGNGGGTQKSKAFETVTKGTSKNIFEFINPASFKTTYTKQKTYTEQPSKLRSAMRATSFINPAFAAGAAAVEAAYPLKTKTKTQTRVITRGSRGQQALFAAINKSPAFQLLKRLQ